MIENFSCSCKDELINREEEHIRNTKCINKVIPNRTKKEWYENNKEQILTQKKQYYEQTKEQKKHYYKQNKEKIKEKSKVWYQNNLDKVKKSKDNYKPKKRLLDKAYREKNKKNRNLKEKIKRDTNPLYRLTTNTRRLILKTFTSGNYTKNSKGSSNWKISILVPLGSTGAE